MTKQTQTTIEQIRADYIPQEPSQFEQLKKLDKKVKAPAEIFAYTFGSVASLILGTGMCLAMKVIGASLSFGMPLGIGIGLVGMALMTINYTIYKKILQSRKNKYADEIIALSDSLLNE